MERDEKFNKVVQMMARAEMDSRQQEHLRVFLFQMIERPEFGQVVDIFDSNPELFDAFAHSFELKIRFFEFGGGESDWIFLLEKEKEVIELAR